MKPPAREWAPEKPYFSLRLCIVPFFTNISSYSTAAHATGDGRVQSMFVAGTAVNHRNSVQNRPACWTALNY